MIINKIPLMAVGRGVARGACLKKSPARAAAQKTFF
jgi:hypothetical protein